MDPQPRFQAEYFVRQNMEELRTFASVFITRLATAFDELDAEAERIQRKEYDRLAALNAGSEDDDSQIAELAYHRGVDFYIATNAIRQGILNLMIAGIFHLFEQHCGSLSAEISVSKASPSKQHSWEHLKKVLFGMGVDVSQFKSATLIEELRLVANTVKHGDGSSANKLRALKPDLFEDNHPMFANLSGPLRPLVGEGLLLTGNHFKSYHACLQQFWTDLTDALLPKFCRAPSGTSA